MDEKTFLFVAIALFIGFIVFFMGRAGEEAGMLKPSEAVTAHFLSHTAAPDLDYYFSGPASRPVAIIAVEKRFRFDGADQWMKVRQGEEEIRVLVEGMQSEALQRNRNLRGFEIVDHRGERIGEWYSDAGIRTVIRRTGIDSVEIWPPSAAKVDP